MQVYATGDEKRIDRTYLCLEAELPTSITGWDQVTHVENPQALIRVLSSNHLMTHRFALQKPLFQGLQMTKVTAGEGE